MTNLKSSNDCPVTNLWQVVSRQMTLLWLILVKCDHFMKIPRWSCDRWLTNLWRVSCVMLLFCEDPKVVNRRSCEHFVKISWQLLMRSRAVIWHPGDYFVTSYCDEWQLFDGWKIIFRRLVDDSVKMFYPSDDFATITESLYDDLETTLWQASTNGQLYNNSVTALQILIWRPCDHAVSCDYTVTTLDTESKILSTWQHCRHRWHRNLS